MSVDKKEWEESFARQQEPLADGTAMNDAVATVAADTAAVAVKKGGGSDNSKTSSATAGAKEEASQQKDAKLTNSTGNNKTKTDAATAATTFASKKTTTTSSTSTFPASLPSVTCTPSPSSSILIKATNPVNTTKTSTTKPALKGPAPKPAEAYRIHSGTKDIDLPGQTKKQQPKDIPTAAAGDNSPATLVPVSPEGSGASSASATPKPTAPPIVTVSTTTPSSAPLRSNAVVTPNAKDNARADDSPAVTAMTPPKGANKTTAAAQEIAKNICVIFPSAMATATANNKKEATVASASSPGAAAIPWVTLHPVFLKEKRNAASVLQGLDAMLPNLLQLPTSGTSSATAKASNSLLAPDWFRLDEEEWITTKTKNNKKKGNKPSLSTEKLCMDRLTLLWNLATDQKAPVLLFLVLLVRIEVAVYLAFRQQQQQQRGGPPAAVGDKTRLKPAQLTNLVETLENLAKQSPSRMTTTQLKEIVAPLVEGGFCSLVKNNSKNKPHSPVVSVKDAKLENLLVTPMPVVIRSFSSVQGDKDETVWERWDLAWSATLQNVRDHERLQPTKTKTSKDKTVSAGSKNMESTAKNKTKTGKTSDKDDEADWMDSSTSIPATAAATPPSNYKRNKKRKKRKKKGKIASVDASAADTVPEEEDSPVPIAQSDKPGTLEDAVEGGKQTMQPPSGNDSMDESNRNVASTAIVAATATETGTECEEPQPRSADTAEEDHGNRENLKPAVTTDASEEDATDPVNLNTNSDFAKLPSDETASTNNQLSGVDGEESAEDNREKSDESVLSVSRVQGVGTVVVAPSSFSPSDGASTNEDTTENLESAETNQDDNFDDWETVEVKGRGNKKRNGRSLAQQASSLSNGGKKNKTRLKKTRERQKSTKVVKDILLTLLDSVEDEVKKRRQHQARSSRNNSNVVAPTVAAWKGGNRAAGLPEGRRQDAALRPAVANHDQTKNPEPEQRRVDATAAATSQSSSPSGKHKHSVSAPLGTESKVQGTGADQQTAATIPETVSAVSETRRVPPIDDDGNIAQHDSSSSDGDETRKQDGIVIPTHEGKVATPAPPLPTLLSAENANSASSSVASSLEAPHASHPHRHTPSANEDDVGYHLLDVCDRLTRDMHVFMARRASALNTRRRERGALLGALQECVSSIWAGHSHVELYGSCATMLDLPSSDLDVVVCGLEQMMEPAMNGSPTIRKNGVSFVKQGEKATKDKSKPDSKKEHHHHAPIPQYVPPVQFNADRVVRLAAELERQPWAVLVKAIPTASVPVIKVLADPSRLPGGTTPASVDEAEWMTEKQAVVSKTTENLSGTIPKLNDAPVPQENNPAYQTAMPPTGWRGADVDNGLLKLDITFEGPEHGGIGSTEFSARVVQNVCDETGLAPENTPFVQVLMVVKELLAQRRLNEPFSGGLSSYSLLLLVLSVMCERKVIHEELERVERQRKAVALGGGNSAAQSPAENEQLLSVSKDNGQSEKGNPAATPSAAPKNKAKVQQTKKSDGNDARAAEISGKSNSSDKSQRFQPANQPRGGNATNGNLQGGNDGNSSRSSEGAVKETKPVGNSWASIAMNKKSEPTSKVPDLDENQQKKTAGATKKPPSSFADAVARNAANSQEQGKAAAAAAAQTAAVARVTQIPPDKSLENTSQARVVTSKDVKKTNMKQGNNNSAKKLDNSKSKAQQKKEGAAATSPTSSITQQRKIDPDEKTSKFNNYSSEPSSETVISSNQSVFPQGFNDVIEVLCSGEATPGKLLMHFLLFYGQHFEGHATAIDISGKHPREIPTHSPLYTHFSPYIQRRSAGVIDPITGIFTVDPIVVYDPLEGAEMNNVARRCFLWGNVKWVFAQSFMTLSSAVEQNTSPPGSPRQGTKDIAKDGKGPGMASSNTNAAWNGPYKSSDKVDIFDPTSPLLELLLSF